MWNPTEADLTTYMHAQAEAAYQQRARPKCSREDFLDGWLACLKSLRSRSSFRPGAWQEDGEEEALPDREAW